MSEKKSPNDARKPATSAEEQDPYIGRTFGDRYEILSKIGEGAQARVYQARHVLIDRLVAVKFLLPVLAAHKSLVERFLNEGRAAGAMGHPNIVESLDMGYAPDGAPYLVFELLKGKTLADEIVLAGSIPAARAAYIASQIASALAAAHAHDIVHRDLKPANVLLVERNSRPDHVKVLDFGVSKFTSGGSRVTTITGHPLGTPGFMAPEQIEDPQSIDSRADVYGLGATLYDMLSGTPPFADVGFPKVLNLIVAEEPRKLAEMKPNLPAGLVAVVERAMSKSPAARFQTMTDFEDALLPFAEEPTRFRPSEPTPSAGRVSATPASRSAPRDSRAAPSSVSWPRDSRVTPVASGGAAAPEPAPAVQAPRRRRKVVALLALLGLLTLASFLVTLHYRTLSEGHGVQTTRPSPNVPAVAAPPPSLSPPLASTPPGVGTETAPQPSATSHNASHTHDKSSSHGSSKQQARIDGVPAPSETPNCSPPFYYEGKKKLFKPGCI